MRANHRAVTDDWDEHWSAEAALNAMNPAQSFRRKLVLEALALDDAKTRPRLLELGSGTGEFGREVLGKHSNVEFVGLDLSQVGVELSRRKVPAARFFQQDFTQPIKLGDEYRGWATHVVCSEVLEHVDDPVRVMHNARPFFAPGCRVVVTVPAGPMSAYARHLGHRRHFTAGALETVLREAGLDVRHLSCAGFPFFNLYRLAASVRGTKAIEDAAHLPLRVRATMRVFSLLFRLNTSKTNLGWQLVAVGIEPH